VIFCYFCVFDVFEYEGDPFGVQYKTEYSILAEKIENDLLYGMLVMGDSLLVGLLANSLCHSSQFSL